MLTQYQLGILWGISSMSDGRIVMRHKHRYFLEQIQCDYGNTIYQQNSNTGIQYVYKIKSDEIMSELLSNGYTARNADERALPATADRDFIKAWLELHSSIYWQTAHSRSGRKYRVHCIHVCGNKVLISELNRLMQSELGVASKAPQRITDKTYFLAYTGKSDIRLIFDEYDNDTNKFEPYWDKLYDFILQSPKDYD